MNYFIHVSFSKLLQVFNILWLPSYKQKKCTKQYCSNCNKKWLEIILRRIKNTRLVYPLVGAPLFCVALPESSLVSTNIAMFPCGIMKVGFPHKRAISKYVQFFHRVYSAVCVRNHWSVDLLRRYEASCLRRAIYIHD